MTTYDNLSDNLDDNLNPLRKQGNDNHDNLSDHWECSVRACIVFSVRLSWLSWLSQSEGIGR